MSPDPNDKGRLVLFIPTTYDRKRGLPGPIEPRRAGSGARTQGSEGDAVGEVEAGWQALAEFQRDHHEMGGDVVLRGFEWHHDLRDVG